MHFRRRGRYHRIDPADIITVPDNTIGLTILHLRSLFYNADSVNLWYSLRTLLHPLFDFVERHMAFFGPFFTVVVFFMLFFFVVIAYLIGVPYWQERSPFVLYIAAILGHWLLINVVFNYYKCLVTSPGYPSDRQLITEATSFCRKCLAPKPPRAHHCKICKSCILKMDHHCPWLNNCIGHYNHRYFFFFCFYTWIGTIYVFIFGIWIFIDHFFPHRSVFKQPMYHSYEIVQGYQKEFTALDYIYDINGLFGISHANLRSRGILYEFWCCLLIFFLVGGLLIYHSILITRGETCIERHINGKNKELYRRFKRYFRAPYDFGRRENWRQFLGLRRNAHPLLSLILPSNFPPHGDGFHWEEVDQGMPGPDLHLRATHHRAPYYRAPQTHHHHHFQKCVAQPPMQYPI